MLLSIITFLPLVFALLLALLPNERWIRPSALLFALVEFAVSLLLFRDFDTAATSLQMTVNIPWVPEFGIQYFLGVDGLSLWLVLLTTFLMPLVILNDWNSTTKSCKGFHAALFLFQTSMIGAFLAMDAILFYVFFELSLLPMFFVIGIWGGRHRIQAALKFFIFTMVGSLMMLFAIIYLMFSVRDTLGEMSASFLNFYQLRIPFVASDLLNPQTLLFAAFTLAFAIKIPMIPLHTWQPDTYTAAPAGGTALLAGVMSKLGAYGLLRFVLPLFPEAAEQYAWVFLFIGAAGIIYAALVAMVQPDFKRLIAYSSISHMSFIVLGLFSMNTLGVSGGLFQMISHGIIITALFLLLGMLDGRTGSREIDQYGGLAAAAPVFTIFFFIATLGSIALPLTNGFVGEFLILLGAFEANKIVASIAVLGVILSASYMLWMIKRVFFGPPGPLLTEQRLVLPDLSVRELTVVLPLALLIFWMGVFPNHFLNWSKASIDHLVSNRDNYDLSANAAARFPSEPDPNQTALVHSMAPRPGTER